MINFETLVFLLVLSNFLVAVFLFVFRLLYRENTYKFRLYIIGKLLQSFAWLFILIRPVIPLLLSVILGNTLLFIGLALEVYVLVNVNKKTHSKELIYLTGIAIACMVAMLLFYTPVYLRYSLHSFSIAFFVYYAAFKFVFLKERTKMMIVTAVMVFVVGCFFVIKGFTHLIDKDTSDIMIPNNTRSITIAIFFLLSYLWPIMFLLIRYEHQNKKMHLMNATRDKIFSIISHDLRSPFTALLGISGIMFDNSKKKDFNLMEKHCVLIQNTAQQSFYLLNNLMEWLQIQTGRIKFNPAEIQINPIIINLRELNQIKLEEKQLKFEMQCDSGLTINGDKFMIETILRNLIGNAIKFTKHGGEIKVVAENLNDKTKISVIDSGIGISEEDKNMILNSDTTFSKCGTNNEKGTGLGLVLCKEFIAKHKGSFHINSITGKGTTFFFIIPKLI